MMKKLEKMLNKILIFFGLKKKKEKVFPDIWRNSQEFQALYQHIKGRTLVTKDRCFMIYQWGRYASGQAGDFAEVGVYKGGTAWLTAQTAPLKKFYLFDTFAGMPKTHDRIDYHKKGDFDDTSLESVKEFLKECPHVQFYPGFFPQTAQGMGDKKFSYVHVDVDIYQSVKDCLEFFYPKMVSGGVMVFDDYEWKDCEGVKMAMDEFLTDKQKSVIVTALYQCVLIIGSGDV